MPLRRVGDFITHETDLETAEREFQRLSNRRRKLDKATREPIPETREEWAEKKARRDFPGVDTPNKSPQLGQLDTARDTNDPPVGVIGADFDEEKGTVERGLASIDETGDMLANFGDALLDKP